MPAQTIQIKRRLSGSPGAPTTLRSSELAFNHVDSTLYIGKGDNGSGVATEVIALAGTSVTNNLVTLDGTQTITGDKTFSGSVNFTGDISGISLDDLDDVSVSGAAAGQILTYDGSSWVPADAPADSIQSIVAAPDSGVYATTDGSTVTIGGIDATTVVKGVVRFATAQEIDDGAAGVVVSAANLKASEYELPVATADILGGIKVGAGLAITGDGVLSATLQGALRYLGIIDVTQPAPADPQQGDLYIAEPAGVADNSFTGIAGQQVLENALVLYDGTEWSTADLQVDAGVTAVSGTDPITVDNSNPATPIIGVKDATTSQKGVVILASAADIGAGTPGKVVTADQLTEVTGAVLPPGTSDGAILTYSVGGTAWISQDFIDGGVF